MFRFDMEENMQGVEEDVLYWHVQIIRNYFKSYKLQLVSQLRTAGHRGLSGYWDGQMACRNFGENCQGMVCEENNADYLERYVYGKYKCL